MVPLLDVCDLEYISILRGITFSVREGEHLVIVGQNGAGKSTLLRCLDLILTDWTGKICLEGVPVRSIPRKEFARKTAFVRQSAEILPDITVRNLVLTGRYPHRGFLTPVSRRDEKIADRALLLTEMDQFAERKLASLSGGERQRVWLAAAVAQEPKLFLLDEPTAFLDYRRQTETYRLLDRIRQETGAALIEVSHDLNRAAESADRVLALLGGKAVYDGDPAGIMNRRILRQIFETELDVAADAGTGRQFVMPKKSSF